MNLHKAFPPIALSFDVSRYDRIHIFHMTCEQFNELITANPQFEPIKINSHEWLSDVFIAGSIRKQGDAEDRS